MKNANTNEDNSIAEAKPDGKGSRSRATNLTQVALAEGNRVEAELPESVPTGSETVLLVEDDEQVRQITLELLESLGYRVLPAANGEQALVIVRQQTGRIHLMITDLVMPRMSGRELAEQLAMLRPDVKVLYMSGYTDDAIVRHGLLDDQLELIQKPFMTAVLALKVRQTLDQRP